jgi:hypothetical protein
LKYRHDDYLSTDNEQASPTAGIPRAFVTVEYVSSVANGYFNTLRMTWDAQVSDTGKQKKEKKNTKAACRQRKVRVSHNV